VASQCFTAPPCTRHLIAARHRPSSRFCRRHCAATCLRVVRETADAVSIVLARADGGAIEFKAGMFYTVIVTIDGQEYRRAYSVSSAAQDNTTVTITVKRVANGKVSNWLNDQLTAGSTLRVLGPSGSFVLEPSNCTGAQTAFGGRGQWHHAFDVDGAHRVDSGAAVAY
jgi:predicted ferric reductase